MGEWAPLFLAALAPRPSPAGGQRSEARGNPGCESGPSRPGAVYKVPLSLGWGQREAQVRGSWCHSGAV